MDRADWLRERKSGIGSSEIAAVAGLSPWSSALEVYARKLDLIPEQEPTAAMRLGLRLEPVIADMYTEQTGLTLETIPLVRRADFTWQIASPDRRVVGQEKLVECKTAGWHVRDDWGEPGTEEVPDYYYAQVQWQLHVTDLAEVDVAALIAGQDFRIYPVRRSQPVIDRLVELATEFWGRVQSQQPPEPDFAREGTAKLLSAIHGNRGPAITLGDDAIGLVDQYQACTDSIRESEKDKEAIKSRLIHMCGDSPLAALPDGRVIRRNEIARKGYEVKPCVFVDFRIVDTRQNRKRATP